MNDSHVERHSNVQRVPHIRMCDYEAPRPRSSQCSGRPEPVVRGGADPSETFGKKTESSELSRALQQRRISFTHSLHLHPSEKTV